MKLWLLSQNEVGGYDVYDSAVVAAETEDDARGIHPHGNDSWGETVFETWASSPENVFVKFIGEASAGTEKGVILASFNAS